MPAQGRHDRSVVDRDPGILGLKTTGRRWEPHSQDSRVTRHTVDVSNHRASAHPPARAALRALGGESSHSLVVCALCETSTHLYENSIVVRAPHSRSYFALPCRFFLKKSIVRFQASAAAVLS